MADDDKRYFRIPKNSGGLTFPHWFVWYCDAEERLNKDHASSRAQKRLVDAVDGKKQATAEVDALDEAKQKVARLKAELEQAEQVLKFLEKAKPKTVPAHEGDWVEMLEKDWTLVLGYLTGSEPPKCGLGPEHFVQQLDGTMSKVRVPSRMVVPFIEAMRAALTEMPEQAAEALGDAIDELREKGEQLEAAPANGHA